tara:strand:- start:881 stop:1138 length:258 start_codon:yes stop_codon:yes gene_type:complete
MTDDEEENVNEDQINDILADKIELPNNSLRVEGQIRISDEGFPLFTLQYSHPINTLTMTRDELEDTIDSLGKCLDGMDRWIEDNR